MSLNSACTYSLPPVTVNQSGSCALKIPSPPTSTMIKENSPPAQAGHSQFLPLGWTQEGFNPELEWIKALCFWIWKKKESNQLNQNLSRQPKVSVDFCYCLTVSLSSTILELRRPSWHRIHKEKSICPCLPSAGIKSVHWQEARGLRVQGHKVPEPPELNNQSSRLA